MAANPKTGRAWLTHCYSMVGAARGNETDSSDGSGLYTVIGHAPRTLDLNITNVGRVVMGMERLSALPRGTGTLGFYVKPEERTPIQRVRVLADVPEAERPKVQICAPTPTPSAAGWTRGAFAAAGSSTARPRGLVQRDATFATTALRKLSVRPPI